MKLGESRMDTGTKKPSMTRQTARATLGALLVLIGTGVLWSLLLWVTFHLPGTSTRRMAELSAGVNRGLTDEQYATSFLAAGRAGLWLIFGLLPILAGLGIGLAGTYVSLGRRGGLLLGSLCAGLAVLAAGTPSQPSAWVGAVGLPLAVAIGDRLRQRRTGKLAHG
jgi:hypothetical protein